MDSARSIGESLMVIITSIILVAILGVLVSSNSQTANVIQAFASAFSEILSVVVSPMGSSSGSSSSSSGSQFAGIGGVGPLPLMAVNPAFMPSSGG